MELVQEQQKLWLLKSNYDKLKRALGYDVRFDLRVTEETETHVDCVLVFDKVDDLIIKIIDRLK